MRKPAFLKQMRNPAVAAEKKRSGGSTAQTRDHRHLPIAPPLIPAKPTAFAEGEIPDWAGQGNCMLSTWVLGREAAPEAVRDRLMAAPFDCIVVMFSKQVMREDPIARWLEEVASKDQRNIPTLCGTEIPNNFLAKRAIHRVWQGTYVVIHRERVTDMDIHIWECRSGGALIRSCGVHLATVHLKLEEKPQRMEHMTLGVVAVRQAMTEECVKDMTEYIIKSRAVVVTGYWGTSAPQLRELAMKTNAICHEPCAQWLRMPDGWRRIHNIRRTVTHPSFYLCFGYFRSISLADATEVPQWFRLGKDLEMELADEDQIPEWPMNDVGSPMVNHLGAIKTKPIDWKLWTDGVIQTCLWLEEASPAFRKLSTTTYYLSSQD